MKLFIFIIVTIFLVQMCFVGSNRLEKRSKEFWLHEDTQSVAENTNWILKKTQTSLIQMKEKILRENNAIDSTVNSCIVDNFEAILKIKPTNFKVISSVKKEFQKSEKNVLQINRQAATEIENIIENRIQHILNRIDSKLKTSVNNLMTSSTKKFKKTYVTLYVSNLFEEIQSETDNELLGLKKHIASYFKWKIQSILNELSETKETLDYINAQQRLSDRKAFINLKNRVFYDIFDRISPLKDAFIDKVYTILKQTSSVIEDVLTLNSMDFKRRLNSEISSSMSNIFRVNNQQPNIQQIQPTNNYQEPQIKELREQAITTSASIIIEESKESAKEEAKVESDKTSKLISENTYATTNDSMSTSTSESTSMERTELITLTTETTFTTKNNPTTKKSDQHASTTEKNNIAKEEMETKEELVTFPSVLEHFEDTFLEATTNQLEDEKTGLYSAKIETVVDLFTSKEPFETIEPRDLNSIITIDSTTGPIITKMETITATTELLSTRMDSTAATTTELRRIVTNTKVSAIITESTITTTESTTITQITKSTTTTATTTEKMTTITASTITTTTTVTTAATTTTTTILPTTTTTTETTSTNIEPENENTFTTVESTTSPTNKFTITSLELTTSIEAPISKTETALRTTEQTSRTTQSTTETTEPVTNIIKSTSTSMNILESTSTTVELTLGNIIVESSTITESTTISTTNIIETMSTIDEPILRIATTTTRISEQTVSSNEVTREKTLREIIATKSTEPDKSLKTINPCITQEINVIIVSKKEPELKLSATTTTNEQAQIVAVEELTFSTGTFKPFGITTTDEKTTELTVGKMTAIEKASDEMKAQSTIKTVEPANSTVEEPITLKTISIAGSLTTDSSLKITETKIDTTNSPITSTESAITSSEYVTTSKSMTTTTLSSTILTTEKITSTTATTTKSTTSTDWTLTATESTTSTIPIIHTIESTPISSEQFFKSEESIIRTIETSSSTTQSTTTTNVLSTTISESTTKNTESTIEVKEEPEEKSITNSSSLEPFTNTLFHENMTLDVLISTQKEPTIDEVESTVQATKPFLTLEQTTKVTIIDEVTWRTTQIIEN